MRWAAKSASATPAVCLQSIQDWAGRRTTFQYDTTTASPHNLLTTVTGPTGCQTVYQYSTFTLSTASFGVGSDWLLSGIIDPNGYGTSYTYDQQKRVRTRSVAGSGVTTYLYQPNAMTTIDVLGNITTQATGTGFAVSSIGNALGAVTTFTRNANNQETSRQTPTGAGSGRRVTMGRGMCRVRSIRLGNRTTYSHDSYNNLTRVQTADGAVTTNLWGYGGSSFDTTGAKRRLQAQVNPLGETTTYAYNSRGQMVSMQNPLGFVMTMGYDSLGNPVTQQDALGNLTTRTYDLAGNVIGQTNALGATWTTTFDNQNRPLTTKDPLGNVSTVAYDSVGNPIVMIDPLGNRTSYTYNVFDKPVKVTDPAGNVRTYTYDNLGRQSASINSLGYRTTTVYDRVGRVEKTVDALGNTTTTMYDLSSRPIATINPQGNRSTTIYNLANRPIANIDALGNYFTTVYDALNRRIASQNPLGYFTTSVFDAAGRQIATVDALGNRFSTSYDHAGQGITSTDPLGRTSTTQYDHTGNVIASVSPLGYRTTIHYDTVGRVESTQDARGNVTTQVYDNASRQSAIINPLGYRTTTAYDLASKPIAIQDALGLLWTTVFDENSRVKASVDPLGNRTTNIYDAVGQAIGQIDALGNRTTTAFDEVGRTKGQQDARGYWTTFAYNNTGQQTAVIAANGGITTSLYDARGMAYASQDPLGAFTSYVYDAVGNTTKRVDARGYVTTYTLDALDRTVGTLYQDGTRVTNTYDAAGQQTTEQDLTGITTLAYDADGRQTSVVYPTSGALTYTFDAVANRTLLVDPDGGRTTYSYDSGNRLTGIVNAFNERTTISYDALNREQHRVLGNGMSSTHTYDSAGRETLLSNYDPTGTARALYTNTYDAVGNRTNVLELDGSRVTYAYDASYQLTNEKRSTTSPYNTTYTYDSLGNRTLKNDSGMLTTYTYNTANEVTQTQQTVAATTYKIDCGSASAVSGFSADGLYGTAGTTLTGSTASTIDTSHAANPAPMAIYQTLRYMNNGTTVPLFYIFPNLTPGATYKLRFHWATYADGGSGRRFINVLVNGTPVISHLDVYATALAAYGGGSGDLKAITQDVSGIADGAGNLIVALTSDPGYTYVSAFVNAIEVLTGSGTVTNAYDPNGNLQTATDWIGVTTYTWDNENRLTRVANAVNPVETYTYAGNGTRRQKVTVATTTNFVWDGENVLQERDSSNSRVAQYTDAPGMWGGLASGRQGSTSYFYGFDSQGSTRILFNGSGTFTDLYTYKAFGEELAQGAAPNALYSTNPYRYVGQYGYYRDDIARLYVRARHLSSSQGRWISRDPIGFYGGDWNIYRYVRNNALINRDPSGLGPTLVFQNCSKDDEKSLRYALEGAISSAANKPTELAQADDCTNEYCIRPNSTQNCLSTRLTGNGKLVINCGCPSDKDAGNCAWTDTSTNIIYICTQGLPSNLPPAGKTTCRPTACVLMHEIIHTCGNLHAGSGARNGNVDSTSDCRCFNCVKYLFPGCDGFYVSGGKHVKFDDCASTASTCSPHYYV